MLPSRSKTILTHQATTTGSSPSVVVQSRLSTTVHVHDVDVGSLARRARSWRPPVGGGAGHRALAKAIFVPSGEKDGYPSSPEQLSIS